MGRSCEKENNQIKRYKEYQEMLENGEAFLAAEDIDNPDRIQPFPGYEQKVIDIKKNTRIVDIHVLIRIAI